MLNKVAVNTNTYHGYTLDDALSGISAAGFRYVELAAVKGWTEHVMPGMSTGELSLVRKKLDDLGLVPVCLSGHCDLMSDERLKDFEENIRLANYFGCEFIVTSTGEAHFGINKDSNEEILSRNITKILRICEDQKVRLLLEVHGEHGTGESLYKIVNKFDTEYLGITYDTANVVYYGNKMPEDDIKTCIDKVYSLHIKDKLGAQKDWNFPALGEGNLNLLKVLDILKEYRYRGPISLEVEFTPEGPGSKENVDRAVKCSYDFLKKAAVV
jgi:sugar phosphate isomerase/epimerase